MLLRPILSRIHKHQTFANFWILINEGHSLASAENAISPSSSANEKSLGKGFVISFLVNSCGLSPENAISASKKVHFDRAEKPNAVLTFLEKQGFSKTQIAQLVAKLPEVLVYNPENSLLPKIESFSHLPCISEAEVLATLSAYPFLLSRSFRRRVGPVYKYVRDIIGVDKVETLLRRGSWAFNLDVENKLIPNVDFLREIGVPQQFIELAVFNFPVIFRSTQVEFVGIVEEVRRMGFDPSKSTFIVAIHARTGKRNIELWDRCCEVYGKWGWSEEDIHMASRKHPNCMLLSEEKISTALDFFSKKMGREARSVARCPQILFYSMENRIVPRCSVVHLLSSKGLVKKDWSLSGALSVVEKQFLDKYVTRYNQELPRLYDIYLSKKARGVEA